MWKTSEQQHEVGDTALISFYSNKLHWGWKWPVGQYCQPFKKYVWSTEHKVLLLCSQIRGYENIISVAPQMLNFLLQRRANISHTDLISNYLVVITSSGWSNLAEGILKENPRNQEEAETTRSPNNKLHLVKFCTLLLTPAPGPSPGSTLQVS